MKELSPIEILNKALEWFALDMEEFLKTPSQHVNKNISKPEAITEIGRGYKELHTTDFLMYADLVIDKLFRDGYLTSNDVGYSGRERLYSISFEGKLFSKAGGYIQQQINANQIREDRETNAKVALRNERRLIRGT
jgi:hypothetical protein